MKTTIRCPAPSLNIHTLVALYFLITTQHLALLAVGGSCFAYLRKLFWRFCTSTYLAPSCFPLQLSIGRVIIARRAESLLPFVMPHVSLD